MPNPPVHHGDVTASLADVQQHGGPIEKGYSRLLPGLAPAYFRPDHLDAAAVRLRMPEAAEAAAQGRWGGTPPPEPIEGENPRIAAAFTYFGQFVDHDLTLDVGSRLERSASDPGFAPVNARTPRFDLDSVYGGGPDVSPFLYTDGAHLRLSASGQDLPRIDGGVAIIPDPATTRTPSSPRCTWA